MLDNGLPDISGIEVCRRLRQYSTAPVIYLTAHQAGVEKVVALDAGGDDYVTKPASIAELLARVRANLRRLHTGPLRVVMRSTAAVISPWTPRHLVTIRGEVVTLTPREFALLTLFMEHTNHVVERQFLLKQVWGQSWFGNNNVLDVFIRQLRLKIEPQPNEPSYIETVRGVGYRLRSP